MAKNNLQLHKGAGFISEYLIDGKTLSFHLHKKGRSEPTYISPFGRATSSLESLVAGWLLLKEPSPFLSGRMPILFCPNCTDLGCGAITASIGHIQGSYDWASFGFEYPGDAEIHQLNEFEHVRGFTFPEEEYLANFRRYYAV